jgi:hypothetical protein
MIRNGKEEKKSVNIAEEPTMIQKSVGCWIRTKEDVQNGLNLRNRPERKKSKSQVQQ